MVWDKADFIFLSVLLLGFLFPFFPFSRIAWRHVAFEMGTDGGWRSLIIFVSCLRIKQTWKKDQHREASRFWVVRPSYQRGKKTHETNEKTVGNVDLFLTPKASPDRSLVRTGEHTLTKSKERGDWKVDDANCTWKHLLGGRRQPWLERSSCTRVHVFQRVFLVCEIY